MDLNEIYLEVLMRERLAEARAWAAAASHDDGPPLRVRLGKLLVRLGERLAGPTGACAPVASGEGR